MNTFKITYNNGDYNITRFNGTIETARRYFLGNTFNLGVGEDLLVKCVNVEEVL